MGIRKRSKTFKNIQKLSENIQKLTRNIRKYSKILQVLAQMVLSGCIRSIIGSAVMGNSSFDFAQDLRFASACANDRFLATTKPRRKINHEFTRMDTNFLDADFADFSF